MRASTVVALVTVSLVSLSTSLQAASLQVAPVSIVVQTPSAAATIKLSNEGANPLEAQIRVFRWVQVDGEEKLEPTEDVVASPPMATLAPRLDYTVRLVRVTKRSLERGETYRLLVDELPDPATRRNGTVALVLRYSIPVFFYPRDAADASLKWSIERLGGRIHVSAVNHGDRHMRISALRLHGGNGTGASFGEGLTGYVLGRSTMRWLVPGNTDRLNLGESVVITAQGDHGPINAAPSK